MKIIKVILIAFTLTGLTNYVFAHPGGHGPPMVAECKTPGSCTKSEIEAAAKKVIAESVNKPLEDSWKDVKTFEASEKSEEMGMTAWKFTFKNKNVKDESKNRVQVVISSEGFLLGAGFMKVAEKGKAKAEKKVKDEPKAKGTVEEKPKDNDKS
jgi:hypothetical protein